MASEEIKQTTVDSVAVKLQSLYDSSSEEEKRVLETLLVGVSEITEVSHREGPELALNITGIRKVAGTRRQARIRIALPAAPRGILVIC